MAGVIPCSLVLSSLPTCPASRYKVPLVLFRGQGGDLLRTVHAGGCRLIGRHDLRLGADLGVVLVPVAGLPAPLCPTGVNVLAAFPVGTFVPRPIALAILCLSIILAGIALPGSGYKTCVHNPATVEDKTAFLHAVTKHDGQPVVHSTDGQCPTAFPDGFLTGNSFNALHAKEPAEARLVSLSDTVSGGRPDRSSVAGTEH